MRNGPWDWIPWNAPREEEVPQAGPSIVLKRVEVGFGVPKVVELHELVGGGLDEEGANHLSGKGDFQELAKTQTVIFVKIKRVQKVFGLQGTHVNEAIYHQLPVA